MKTIWLCIRIALGFLFGLTAETFARLVLLCDKEFTVNFDYLREHSQEK